ncbi:hypothetical protein B0T14DRAFT_294339 [Immersiella caudata]|uniref:Uncharacterized protein n=1 Tax=Immersiella caudata TaxID=314043 RepID=A0AA39WET1_9PEZI|nr:hypothetical protein B0T14DRAFT_294339 [Immersiella caudata]
MAMMKAFLQRREGGLSGRSWECLEVVFGCRGAEVLLCQKGWPRELPASRWQPEDTAAPSAPSPAVRGLGRFGGVSHEGKYPTFLTSHLAHLPSLHFSYRGGGTRKCKP